MNSNKLKLFVENFFVYGLGSVIGKVIPLVMLPIVTRLMPDTSYFGINDLYNTASSFAGAIATLGMYDGMYRMFFEDDRILYKKKVCSTTLTFTAVVTALVSVLIVIFRDQIAAAFFGDVQYSYMSCLVAISTMVSATNNIISAPTRMENKKGIYLITNFISSVLSYAIAIPLLLKGFYLIALPISAIAAGFSVEIIFSFLNRNWFSAKLFDKDLLITTLKIALPLFPNFLVYWIFNSCDRIMISKYMTVNDVGIYSIGAKLGNMSQLIYNAFAGGWLFFSFSTMKEKKQVENNSLIFEYMGVISFSAASIVFACSYIIYQFLFEGDYVEGYRIAPFLFLAPLLQMLFQILCNQFVIIKKTWPNVLLLLLGAIGNIVLNMILIPAIGIEGASIATLLGYIITLVFTIVALKRLKLVKIRNKFYGSCCLFVTFIVIWTLLLRRKTLIAIALACVYIIINILVYKSDLKLLVSEVKKKHD